MTLVKALTMAAAIIGYLQTGVNYHVTSYPDHADVINAKYAYEFSAPRHWHVSETNPVPYAFSYPPRKMQSAQIGVPTGGAELSIVDDEDTYNIGSIDNWIKKEKGIRGYASTKEMPSRINPLIPRAVELVSFQDDGDSTREMVTQRTEVFFEFGDHLFAAILRFNANDPKARQYEKCLYDVLRSFQKVPTGSAAG